MESEFGQHKLSLVGTSVWIRWLYWIDFAAHFNGIHHVALQIGKHDNLQTLSEKWGMDGAYIKDHGEEEGGIQDQGGDEEGHFKHI